MPAATSEADIIFNRANVALAKSQRLISSWLPPRTEEELRNAKTDVEIEKEEEEMFTPMPELLGLGAPLPKDIRDGDFKRPELSANDRLRKLLLGKDFKRLSGDMIGSRKVGFVGVPLGSKPRPIVSKTPGEEEDDEEGRSALGKSKTKRPISVETADEKLGAVDEKELDGKDDGSSRPIKRGSTYLDDVLAEKQRKKHKKKRKSTVVLDS